MVDLPQLFADRNMMILRRSLLGFLVLGMVALGATLRPHVPPNESLSAALYVTLLLFLNLMWRHVQHRFMVGAVVWLTIALTTASVVAYGSLRGGTSMGYFAAIVVAGLFFQRNALLVVLCTVACLFAALVWAQEQGLMVTPSYHVNTRYLLVMVTTAFTCGWLVFYIHTQSKQAMREQHRELQRRVELEQQLQASLDRFSRIFRHNPTAIVVYALADGTALDVNPAFERMYGYTRDEFVGTLGDACLWGSLDEQRQFHQLLAANHAVSNFRAHGQRADGSKLVVRIDAGLESDAPRGLCIAMISDISQEVQAVAGMRRAEERFAKAFRVSPLAMTISRLSDGRILESTGPQTMPSAHTLNDRNSRGETARWAHAADREAFIRKLRAQGQINGHDALILNRRGKPLQLRLWATLIDLEGEECVLTASINVTEEKRRDAVLVELARGMSADTGEALFKSLAQHLSRAIRADMVVIGEFGDEATIRSLALIQGGELQANMAYPLAGSPCQTVLARNGLCTFPDHLLDQFGEHVAVRQGAFQAYSGAALRDTDDTPIGIICAMWKEPLQQSSYTESMLTIFATRAGSELVRLRREREISKLRETLENRVRERTAELEAVNAELDSFAYSVAHDLKSPLRAIDGFTRILSEQMHGRLSDSDQQLFDRVLASTRRMNELITDLLALAQVSQGHLSLDRVDLSAMMAEVMANQQQHEPQRQVKLHIQPGIVAHCDGKLARIVLENLVSNAWKYTRKQPLAEIEFGQREGSAQARTVLFVRDNGIGFDMNHAAGLFKPFHRLHQNSEFEGAGIGLATVHRVLERHRGYIEAVATPGSGACFYFSFDPPATLAT